MEMRGRLLPQLRFVGISFSFLGFLSYKKCVEIKQQHK